MRACAGCGATAASDQAFCGACGTPLGAGCRTCQTTLTPGLRFCTRCGTPVNEDDALGAGEPPRPEAERRLCSVLFVDLVGFTPLSEGRDPEEVRELLSEYFAIARQAVGRYGGVIEKFIGDAVMAVWGTPVAAEGNAGRAVRAGLDVVAGVAELGARIGSPGLSARAGVVTGTVATTPGADGQAMVAGDPVNTAARVQSAAPGGAVLIDTTTARLVSRAIDLEPYGDLELKGNSRPASVWRARQVLSGIRGACSPRRPSSRPTPGPTRSRRWPTPCLRSRCPVWTPPRSSPNGRWCSLSSSASRDRTGSTCSSTAASCSAPGTARARRPRTSARPCGSPSRPTPRSTRPARSSTSVTPSPPRIPLRGCGSPSR